jgi:hypothetical protein
MPAETDSMTEARSDSGFYGKAARHAPGVPDADELKMHLLEPVGFSTKIRISLLKVTSTGIGKSYGNIRRKA